MIEWLLSDSRSRYPNRYLRRPLSHDLLHRRDNFGRLVQHFLGKCFDLVAVNQLRFETLLFGVGNELGAGERFGITRAQ